MLTEPSNSGDLAHPRFREGQGDIALPPADRSPRASSDAPPDTSGTAGAPLALALPLATASTCSPARGGSHSGLGEPHPFRAPGAGPVASCCRHFRRTRKRPDGPLQLGGGVAAAALSSKPCGQWAQARPGLLAPRRARSRSGRWDRAGAAWEGARIALASPRLSGRTRPRPRCRDPGRSARPPAAPPPRFDLGSWEERLCGLGDSNICQRLRDPPPGCPDADVERAQF